jgi:mRNA interferase HigB
MIVVGLKKLDEFKKKHTNCKIQVDAWINEAEHSNWKSFNDIKLKYPSVSILKNNTIIFNLKGNKYRLVTVVVIVANRIYIEWIGTHEEYNKLNFN